MSEQLNVAGAIDRHFESMNPDVRRHIFSLAKHIGGLSTTSLHATSPNAIVTMPAALLDEDMLDRAVATMLEHDDRSPHWTLLNGNTTKGAIRDPRIFRNFAPVQERIETDAASPLGAFLTVYAPGTPMGTVRADLIDAGIAAYWRQCKERDVAPRDIMLVNADADTRHIVSLTGGPYVSQVARERRQSGAEYLEVYPAVRHADIDNERFPRMHRLIEWRDYMNAKFGFSYAAHYATNLYGYLDSGGFDRSWDSNEQLKMGTAMAERAAATGKTFKSVPLNHVIASVSPRRYAIELLSGQHMGYGPLRVPRDGRLVHEAPRKFKDIPTKVLRRELEYEVQRVCARGLEKFAAEHAREHTGSNPKAALDYAFERVQDLIKEERQDAPNIEGLNSIVLEALAGFGREVEKKKAAVG